MAHRSLQLLDDLPLLPEDAVAMTGEGEGGQGLGVGRLSSCAVS